MKLAALFSGGKDSTYSIYKAKQDDHQIKCLVTLFPKSPDSQLLHFPNVELTKFQSETMKIPQITAELSSNEVVEEMNALETLLQKAKQDFQIDGIVHGIGLKIVSPLWKTNPKEYMNEIISSGFQFILTSVSSDGLDETWLGKIISKSDISKLSKLSDKFGFNLNFEGGEAETFVVDCPLYSYPLNIIKSKITWDGYRGVLQIDNVSLDFDFMQEKT